MAECGFLVSQDAYDRSGYALGRIRVEPNDRSELVESRSSRVNARACAMILAPVDSGVTYKTQKLLRMWSPVCLRLGHGVVGTSVALIAAWTRTFANWAILFAMLLRPTCQALLTPLCPRQLVQEIRGKLTLRAKQRKYLHVSPPVEPPLPLFPARFPRHEA